MKSPFTYCIIRYTPDPGAGESLNIGVLMLAHTDRAISWRFDHHYRRLSEAFAGFNGLVYRQSIERVEEALRAVSDSAGRELIGGRAFTSALEVFRAVISDEGLSLSISEPRGGVTSDAAGDLAMLFERMVESRGPEKAEYQRRTDDHVWRTVFAPRIPPDVINKLTPKKFTTTDTEVEFDHAYKNGLWHLVQTVSLDYKTSDTIQKKAQQWAGTSLGLESAQGIGTIYFLLGAPREQKLMKSYERAKNLIGKAPVPHAIVEERDADKFAEQITDIVRHARHD